MRRILFLLALLAIPTLTLAQGGAWTAIRAVPEPLPSCTPATQPFQSQPLLWDITAQAMKTCIAPNTWSTFGGEGGGSVTIVTVSGTTSNLFTVTVNNPTTTPNLAFVLPTESAHFAYIGPSSGGATIPTFRLLTATDLPVIALANTPLTTNGDVLTVISGTLARLGQGGNGTFLGVSGGVLGYFTPSGAGTVTNTCGTLTANHLAYGNGTSDICVLASLGTTTTVLHGNGGGLPTFGSVNLSTDVIGNLPVGNLNSGSGASATTFWRGDGTWQAPSVLWNNLGNPTGNLSLAMGTNTSTFNQTNAAPWTWANVTAAVSGTPQNSPIQVMAGTYFNGSASATDSWSEQVVMGTANNGPSTLTFSHSGSSGLAAVSVPQLFITGITSNVPLCGSASGQVVTGCSSGSSFSLTVNGGSALTSPVNMQAGPAYQGLTINALNPSGSNVSFQLAGTLAIAAGGTGQTTAINAFNALTPMNTTGDMEIFNSGTAQRVALGTTGFCWVAGASIPGWANCPGGISNPMTTLGDMIQGGAAGAPIRLAGPTGPNGVPQQLINVPSGGVATAEQWATAGVPVRVNTGATDLLLTTDRTSYVSESNATAVTFTFPNTSGAGFAGNFVFVTPNLGTASVALTPNAAQNIDGTTSSPVFPGWAAWVYQNNAATGWLSIRVPMAAAFPSCTSATCALGFNPSTGLTTNTSIAAANVPFSGITSATNTLAAMVLGSGSSLAGTGTATINFSALTSSNAFLLPVIAGAVPTTAGALAFDSTSQTLRVTVSAATNMIPTFVGTTAPSSGSVVCWGANMTQTASGCGGSGTITQIIFSSPLTGGTITTSGTVGCGTCVVATAPGPGIAHFAGSTQTVTSSPVSLTADVSGILPVPNGGTGLSTQTANVIYKGNGTGVELVSSITDNGTTIASPEPLVLGTATCTTFGTAGGLCPAEGTNTTNVAGAQVWNANSTTHEIAVATNGSNNFGMLNRTQPGAIHSTGNTGAISTATLCAASAGACNQSGQYHIHWDFIETGTACSVPATGGVTFLLTWTDTAGTTHSAVSLGMDDASAINAVSQTFHFQTSLAAAWGSGDFNISTNGTVIQYATGYTACGTGTGTYQLDISVVRPQ